MAMVQLETSWTRGQLFDQTIALVTDDPNWMVQSQSDETLVLRREKSIGMARYIWGTVIVFLTIFTCGLALLLVPTLFINLSNQQISMRTTQEGGKTKATINYTNGARKRITTLINLAPK